MAQAYKTLGQVAPGAATLTTLYTVPASTSTVVSTITVCNTAAVATTYRLSIQIAAAADNVKQYIAYDAPILANETRSYTLGITLATTDVLKCYATLATVSFSAFGAEIT
jgi:hypothetical protein